MVVMLTGSQRSSEHVALVVQAASVVVGVEGLWVLHPGLSSAVQQHSETAAQ